VNIGAIVTVATEFDLTGSYGELPGASRSLAESLGGSPFASREFLGGTLLQFTLDNLREFGVRQEAVLFEESSAVGFNSCEEPEDGHFFSAWENAVAQQLYRGAEIIFLIRLSSYLEIDFADLVRFHRETSSVLTQVYDKKGAFDVVVVSADHLQTEPGSYRRRLSALIPYHRRYTFRGYSNRLRQPQDFRQLVRDSLSGRNSIRPNGREVSPALWLAEGASVDSSARVTAPAYIGANTQIKGSCVINGGTAIERDCEVDFGATITDSCVLPETYVGLGLNIVHSIVSKNGLFNLDRNVGVEISDRSLIGRQNTSSFLRRFTKSINRRGSLEALDVNSFGAGQHL
jgi:hypothetical protein